MTPRTTSRLIVAIMWLMSAPVAVRAEDSPGDGSRVEQVATPVPNAQGPLIVERVKSGFLVAPDFKVTNVDRKTSELAGGYAGWLTDKTLFIGGGGYWLANRDSGRKMAYGGVVVGWLARADRRVGFGAKALVGGGEATLTTPVTEMFLLRDGRDSRIEQTQPLRPGQAPAPLAQTFRTVNVRLRDSFFVAEPEANVLFNLSRSFRLTAGIGYRLVGADRNLDDRLRGVTGSVALQIGGGS